MRPDTMGSARLRIVSASPKDAGVLTRFECEAWGIRPNKYAFWIWVLQIRYQVVLKAIDGGRLVGVASAHRTATGGVYIDEVIIAKAHRRQGIASELMEQIISEEGIHRTLIALTWTTNAASRGLLKKFGFKAVRSAGHLFGNKRKTYWEYERPP